MLIFHRTECCKSPNALFFKVLKVLSHGFFHLNASSYSFALNIALYKVILWLFPGGLSLRMLKKCVLQKIYFQKKIFKNFYCSKWSQMTCWSIMYIGLICWAHWFHGKTQKTVEISHFILVQKSNTFIGNLARHFEP